MSPSDNLRSLPDDALVEHGLAASSADERRAVEYEMWRRQTMLGRRAILVAEETGRGGEIAGRWAIAIGLIAIALTLLLAWVADTDPTRRAFYIGYLALVILTSIGNGVTFAALLRERLAARAKLKEFDAEHGLDASG